MSLTQVMIQSDAKSTTAPAATSSGGASSSKSCDCPHCLSGECTGEACKFCGYGYGPLSRAFEENEANGKDSNGSEESLKRKASPDTESAESPNAAKRTKTDLPNSGDDSGLLDTSMSTEEDAKNGKSDMSSAKQELPIAVVLFGEEGDMHAIYLATQASLTPQVRAAIQAYGINRDNDTALDKAMELWKDISNDPNGGMQPLAGLLFGDGFL